MSASRPPTARPRPAHERDGAPAQLDEHRVEYTDTDELYERIAAILDEARSRVARAVNVAMVQAYWEIGFQLIEQEQRGDTRAEYGSELVENISTRLTTHFGRGFSKQNLWRMRQFYTVFPNGSTVQDPQIVAALRRESEGSEIVAAVRRQSARFPPNLSWTHYRKLLTVEDPQARAFYELEAARANWSTRDLERQRSSTVSRASSSSSARGFASWVGKSA